MSNLDYYAPSRMPPQFNRFEEPLTQLAVGTEGKLGALRIRLRKSDEKTIVEDLFSKIPFQVLRALYIDENLPEMAFIYIMTPMAHFTTQAATKVYRMNKNYATQVVNIGVEEGAYLEFIPDLIIPYREARFYHEVNLRVHDDATVIYAEMIAPGRAARGEAFQFDIYYSKIVARSQENDLRFIDTVVLEPKRLNVKTMGALGTYTFLGNLYLLTKKTDVVMLSDRIHSALQGMETDLTGSSGVLPRGDGILVRVLGNASALIRQALEMTWDIIRREVLHVPACRIRKY